MLRRFGNPSSGGVRLTATENYANFNSLLGYLNLGGTKITDAGLKELRELRRLTSLNLGGTRVGPGGVGLKALRESLPYAQIFP